MSRPKPKPLAYVVGFLFDEGMENILLIEKNRPDWQRGKLNGHGGKIELDEDIYTAVMRETYEELGVWVDIRQWRLFQVEKFRAGVKVYFFYARNTAAYNSARAMTDEQVEKFALGAVPYHRLIANLGYLIPMAIVKALYIQSDVRPLIPYLNDPR